jgi:hypothetical protein
MLCNDSCLLISMHSPCLGYGTLPTLSSISKIKAKFSIAMLVDRGTFFPGTGAPHRVGSGLGLGTNVNVGWDGPGVGDGDYMAAFE